MSETIHPARIIERKRDGWELTSEEIDFFLTRYVDGRIPDYQMAALAMAICVRGMTFRETSWLTESMLRTGQRLQWSGETPVVDKHSTGGVGDKVSLVLVPLLACCGVRVPMISGRGLGLTGGTLDKLESIPGFRTDLSLPEIQRLTDQVGCVITGATKELVPADRKLYALRDVTGTVPSVPLITASILSKKLTEGLDALVLDVKYGCGTFMKTPNQARALARSMIAVGHRLGVKTIALITEMNRPLGRAIGNAIEVEEAMRTLAGADGPRELWELVLVLASELLVASGRHVSWTKAERALVEARDSGAALEKFRQMVRAQGGDLSQPLPKAPAHEISANRSGFIASIDAERLGQVVTDLGAGRRSVTDSIDHAVGVELLVQVGDSITLGTPIARILAPPAKAEAVRKAVAAAFKFSDEPVHPGPRVIDRMDERNVGVEQTEPTRADGPGRLEKANTLQPMSTDSDIERLIRAARVARNHAHTPYSSFRVGAAVLTSDGTIAAGCNVENASFGLTLCAERVAVASAVAAGHRDLKAVAIVAEGNATPCGACRQFLAEFGTDIVVYVTDAHDTEPVRRWQLAELLPESFQLDG